MKIETKSLPNTVLNAIILIFVAQLLSIIVGVRDISSGLLPNDVIRLHLLGNIVALVVYGCLSYEMIRARRWARIIIVILFFSWFVPIVLLIINQKMPAYDSVTQFSQISEFFFKVISIYLLYTPSANFWFLERDIEESEDE